MTLVFFNLFDWFCCLLRFEFTILFFVHFTDKLNQLNHRSIDLNWHCWFDCYRRCCFVFFHILIDDCVSILERSWSLWWAISIDWLIHYNPLRAIFGFCNTFIWWMLKKKNTKKASKWMEMKVEEILVLGYMFILCSFRITISKWTFVFFRVNLMGCIWSLETWKRTPKGKNFFQFTRSICCIIFKSNNFAILLFCRLFRLPFSSWKMIYGLFCSCLIYHHHHHYYLDNGKHVQNLITILY